MGAGQASRMGKDKLALPWGNTTVFGHVLQTINSALKLCAAQDGAKRQEVVVIARKPMTAFYADECRCECPEASRINNAIKSQESKFSWIQVPDPLPLANTIRMGLSDLTDLAQGICFIPGDQVGLEAHVLAELTTFFLDKTPDFLVPQVDGVTGSPVFFHVRYLPELLALQGEQGGKRVLEIHRERWTTYPVREEFFLDIDTKEEYEKYRPELVLSMTNRH